MASQATPSDQILAALSHSPEWLMEELVFACPELTWNQIFLEVDRLSREGRVLLARKEPGVYAIRLASKKDVGTHFCGR